MTNSSGTWLPPRAGFSPTVIPEKIGHDTSANWSSSFFFSLLLNPVSVLSPNQSIFIHEFCSQRNKLIIKRDMSQKRDNLMPNYMGLLLSRRFEDELWKLLDYGDMRRTEEEVAELFESLNRRGYFLFIRGDGVTSSMTLEDEKQSFSEQKTELF